jgi:hypothetical protein
MELTSTNPKRSIILTPDAPGATRCIITEGLYNVSLIVLNEAFESSENQAHIVHDLEIRLDKYIQEQSKEIWIKADEAWGIDLAAKANEESK